MIESMRSDLLRLVDDIQNFGLFHPGEAEGWREDIEMAEVVSELMMMMNEPLLQFVEDRDGYDEFRERIGVEETPPSCVTK